MTRSARSIEGGVYEIPSPITFGGELASPTATIFEAGDLVTRVDRDAPMTVLSVEADRIQVQCVDRNKGSITVAYFSPSALRLILRKPRQIKLPMFSASQLREIERPKSLIRGVIHCVDLACLYGPPGTWKTFLALCMALSVASSRSCWGRPVRGGRVVYIAAEGVYSVSGRIEAWAYANNLTDVELAAIDAQLHVMAASPSFTDGEFDAVVEAILALPSAPILIVVDTAARCMGDADENQARDMGRFIRACDRLRERFGSAVLLVHHSGKVDPAKERGSTALRGACDVMFGAARVKDPGPPRVELRNEKQKDAEPFPSMRFDLRTFVTGQEEDGTPITSGCVELVEDDPASDDALDGQGGQGEHPDVRIQRALADLFFDDGATAAQIIEATGVSKTTVYKRLKPMCDAGLLTPKTVGRSRRFTLAPASPCHSKPAARNEVHGGAANEIPVSIPVIPEASRGNLASQFPVSRFQSRSLPLGRDGERNGKDGLEPGPSTPQHTPTEGGGPGGPSSARANGQAVGVPEPTRVERDTSATEGAA